MCTSCGWCCDGDWFWACANNWFCDDWCACKMGIFMSGWIWIWDGNNGGNILSAIQVQKTSKILLVNSMINSMWKHVIKTLQMSTKLTEIEKNRILSKTLPLIGDVLGFDCSEYFGLRFLVWMPSFFMLCGRLTLCSLKYNPQALQTGSPWLFRRHSVVVLVLQFAQITPDRRLACACRKKWPHLKNEKNLQNL